jgi:hypothetical protein
MASFRNFDKRKKKLRKYSQKLASENLNSKEYLKKYYKYKKSLKGNRFGQTYHR